MTTTDAPTGAPTEVSADATVDAGPGVRVDGPPASRTPVASRRRVGTATGTTSTTAVDVARWSVGALAVLAVSAYAVVALLRFRTGGELEWMEGGMVQEVRDLLAGHAPYGPPTLASTPYLYTPLFTYLGAAVSWVVGPGLEPLRAISIVSSFVAFWATYRLVVVETRDRWAGLVAAGVLAASYVLCGAWFDVGRVDSLMLALVLAGLLLVRTSRDAGRAALAGIVMVLAVMAKQDALLVALACVPWMCRRGRRPAVAYVASLLGGLAVSVVGLQLLTEGWFLYYVIDVPAAHRLVPGEYLGFVTRDLRPFLWSAAVVVLALVAARRRVGSTGVRWWFLAPVVASLLLTGWVGRVHSGGWDNVLIPAVAGIALLVGVAAAVARHRAATWVVVVCLALLAGQFVALRWSPADQLPAASADARTDRVVAALRELPGPVYLPGHPWLLVRAGRQAGAQSAALADVLRGPKGLARRDLRGELETAVREQRFGAVVVDSVHSLSYLPEDFPRYYRHDHDLLPDGHRLAPATGTATGPSQVWLPR